MPKEGDLRLWWIPQIPMNAFRASVSSVEEAARLYWTLAQYDIFQFENNIKPDYCNVGGLEIFQDGEWTDWEDEDGEGISELVDRFLESGDFILEVKSDD